MDGPRGTLVIGLLFLIAGQLAFIASALSGNDGGSVIGIVMTAFFVLAVIRLVVELLREGAEHETCIGAASPGARARAADESPTATKNDEGAAAALDPQKRRPVQS